jgi:hypothetical protein
MGHTSHEGDPGMFIRRTLPRSPGLLTATAVVVLLVGGTSEAAVRDVPTSTAAVRVTADRPQPATPAETHFLDHGSYLAGLNDPGWYEANIPFVDLPDKTIQDVYYYRWRVWKEHLRYTNPTDGWISTEFLDCCGYAAPYQAVNAAAGHQISEGRWLRDPSYLDDYTRFWLTGPGSGPKPATDAVNADTTDWAHEYSFWLASAAYGRAQVSGDFSELTSLLPQLERQYRGWDKQFNPRLGLYWSVPVWDAMELSASSYQSSDPYHGGAGYRPTMNSYQYGDAVAISKIAALAHDQGTAEEYAKRAAGLKTAMQKWLWDPERKFYYAMARDDNPDHTLLDTREEIGFVPWQFGAAQPADSVAWAQLSDPQGFAGAYGPTTAERRSPLFMHEAGGCCRWDGPSWPFATAQTLTGLANQLNDYPAQTTVTKADYADALATFARTQYKNGRPYVAEAHDPDRNTWIYDGFDHSEDYNHSTFDDLVLSGLLGLRPQTGASFRLHPLVPAGWDHYAMENVPYHGHNVTVLWDRDGSHYDQGAGMHVYVDAQLVRSSPTLRDMTVPVPARGPHDSVGDPVRRVNDAANPLREGYPKPVASYTWRADDPWNALDGKVWFNEVPQNTRWTNYSSPNAQDYYGVDFGVPTQVSDIRWYGYDDGGGVKAAADYRVQYRTDAGWADVPDQTRDAQQAVGNGPNRITFPTLTTTQLRLLFTNPQGAFVGVTELQSWSPSSADAAVSVGPRNGTGTVPVDGPTPVTVTVRNATAKQITDPTVSLSLPAGWTATPAAAGAPAGPIPAGGEAHWQFLLTPSGDTAPGTTTDIVATAGYTTQQHGVESTHTRQPVTIAYAAGQADPVGRWTMDEGAGTVAHDGSGEAHDLALQGDPTWAPGRSGTALAFDGTSQSAQTSGPVLDTRGNFSVAAWVRLDSTGHFATAVSQDGSSTSGFFLQYSAADGRFAFSTGEGRALADQPPTTGRWSHLVGVHDANAGTYTLYVDGTAQRAVLHQSPGDAAAGPFAVGRGFSAGRPSDFWPGAVDQVQAWDRVLTSADVAAVATSSR